MNVYRSLLVQAINEWCSRNGEAFGVNSLKLVEDIDFFISTPSVNGDFIHTRCGCRTLAKLPRQGSNFPLSNYYRRLKTGKCSMIKSKLRTSSTNVHQRADTEEEENESQQEILIPSIFEVLRLLLVLMVD